MILNAAERWLVNNPARALVQRFYEVPLLLKLGGRVQNGTVLEVGCGRGVAPPLLLARFGAAQVHGVDVDPSQVARAARRVEGRHDGHIQVSVASVDHLPFSTASFDAVFDFGILHHVPDWQAAVGEISRVLKPGGTLYFEEVTRAVLERWMYRAFFEHPSHNRFDETEFLEALRVNRLAPGPHIHRVLFGDIVIGVATQH